MKAKLMGGEGIEIEIEIDDEAIGEMMNIGDKDARINLNLKSNKGKWELCYMSISKDLDKTSTVSYNYDKEKPKYAMVSDIKPIAAKAKKSK